MRRNLLFPVLLLFLLASKTSQSQILISLLFGDKLNSGKIEFGLDGGLAVNQLSGIANSKTYSSFNLGFYFDIKLKQHWMLHTGVLVKSQMGAKNITYNLNEDNNTNSLFLESTATRKLKYFNVPIYAKYRTKSNISFEAGPQVGLLYKAKDIFKTTNPSGKTITLENGVKNQYHNFDLGISGGIGYKLMKGTGINMGIRYYLGLLNISKNNDTKQYNRTFYLYAGIPIGAGKKKNNKS